MGSSLHGHVCMMIIYYDHVLDSGWSLDRLPSLNVTLCSMFPSVLSLSRIHYPTLYSLAQLFSYEYFEGLNFSQ